VWGQYYFLSLKKEEINLLILRITFIQQGCSIEKKVIVKINIVRKDFYCE